MNIMVLITQIFWFIIIICARILIITKFIRTSWNIIIIIILFSYINCYLFLCFHIISSKIYSTSSIVFPSRQSFCFNAFFDFQSILDIKSSFQLWISKSLLICCDYIISLHLLYWFIKKSKFNCFYINLIFLTISLSLVYYEFVSEYDY